MRNDTVVTVAAATTCAGLVIERVELDFDLDSTQTTVTSRFTVRPEPRRTGRRADLARW